jgi:hypothetical protein
MKTGTKSLLFGVHQFIWHPITVWLAWRRLYGCPSWRECVCIVVHDWGYWGCAEMDGPCGSLHPKRGATIARNLFGEKYAQLVMWHSRSLARRFGTEPSKLCWPDKLSMIYDPQWFYLIRARLSGELAEYRENAARVGFVAITESDAVWHSQLVQKLEQTAELKAEELKIAEASA